MNVTMMSASLCTCPTCHTFTMAMPNGQGEFCPGCHSVIKAYSHVKLVRPNAYRHEALRP